MQESIVDAAITPFVVVCCGQSIQSVSDDEPVLGLYLSIGHWFFGCVVEVGVIDWSVASVVVPSQ